MHTQESTGRERPISTLREGQLWVVLCLSAENGRFLPVATIRFGPTPTTRDTEKPNDDMAELGGSLVSAFGSTRRLRLLISQDSPRRGIYETWEDSLCRNHSFSIWRYSDSRWRRRLHAILQGSLEKALRFVTEGEKPRLLRRWCYGTRGFPATRESRSAGQ